LACSCWPRANVLLGGTCKQASDCVSTTRKATIIPPEHPATLMQAPKIALAYSLSPQSPMHNYLTIETPKARTSRLASSNRLLGFNTMRGRRPICNKGKSLATDSSTRRLSTSLPCCQTKEMVLWLGGNLGHRRAFVHRTQNTPNSGHAFRFSKTSTRPLAMNVSKRCCLSALLQRGLAWSLGP
jgi:hypothetical protein